MVVDLAIEGDPHTLIAVAHRLMTALHVDDREPAMAEPDRTFGPDSLAVGTAVREQIAHAFDAFCRDVPIRVETDDTDDATHDGIPGQCSSEQSFEQHV